MLATTHPMPSVREAVLFVAFELGKKDWKLAMTSGFGVTPWLRSPRRATETRGDRSARVRIETASVSGGRARRSVKDVEAPARAPR